MRCDNPHNTNGSKKIYCAKSLLHTLSIANFYLPIACLTGSFYNHFVTKKLFGIFPLILIVLVAAFFRWWHIDSVAPGISIDELDYQLTAKSFYLTGTDLKGKTPTLGVLAFHYPTTDDTKAELPYLIQMPFIGPFPFSLPLTRLPFVLMSIGTVIILYFLGKELVSKEAGIAAGFLGAINPFLVVLGRTNYEVTGASFFYPLTLLMLIKLKGWKILWTIPLFLCSFYVYIGTKLLFIPFALWSLGFAYFYINKRKFAKQYLIILGVLFVFIGFYITILRATPTNRLGELLTPNSKEIIHEVNTIRHVSLATPLNSIVINKYTLYIRSVVNSFFMSFSADFLLDYGDGFFRLYDHGVLYYADVIFLIAAVGYFAKKKNRLGIYVLGFLLIATFPQIFHDGSEAGTNYSHSSLMFPFVVLLAGIGAAEVWQIVPKKVLPVIASLFVITYIFSIAYFMQAYFYQYSLQGHDEFSMRELAKYLTLASPKEKHIVVLSSVGATHFKKYLYYANALNTNSIADVKNAFITGNLQAGNVKFISCERSITVPKDTLVIEDAVCNGTSQLPHDDISLVVDGGIAYKIYNDPICSTYSLKHYAFGLTLSDFAVEKLSTQTFCEDFITR